MEAYIKEGLKKYKEEKCLRLHMPGHKGKRSSKITSDDIYSIDVTEVEGLDNLMHPEDIIENSMRQMREYYKTQATLFSVNGSTGGIIGAILAASKPKDKILISRDSHRSVYNAIILGDLNPVYIQPSTDIETGINIGIDINLFKEQVTKHKPKVIVIANPNYYGIASDIKSMAEITHQNDAVLIVDEAHGAHFPFSEKLPKTAIESGADIVVQSVHKMLGGLTQTALVHLCSDRITAENLNESLFLTQTTSPSYILMESIEAAFIDAKLNGRRKIEEGLALISELKTSFLEVKGIKVYDKSYFKQKGAYDFDESKIIVNIDGYTGFELQQILRDKYNIQAEMADIRNIVFLTTYADESEVYMKLKKALLDIKPLDAVIENIKYLRLKNPQVKISIREARNLNSRWESIEDVLDKVSKSFIIPYPPGYPIVCPGEIISQEIIEYIKQIECSGQTIIGLDNHKVLIALIYKDQN